MNSRSNRATANRSVIPARKSRVAASRPSASIMRASRKSAGRSRTFSHKPPRIPEAFLNSAVAVRRSRRPRRTGTAQFARSPRARIAHADLGPVAAWFSHDVLDHGRDPGRRDARAPRSLGRERLVQDLRPNRIVDVVVYVRHQVSDPHDLSFDGAGAQFRGDAHRRSLLPFRVLPMPSDLPGQIQPLSVVLAHA